MALTAVERETVILMDDSSDDAIVTTYQKTLINSLRKNPGAVEVLDAKLAKWGGAEFRVPAKLVNIRRPRRESATRAERDKATAQARMANARAAKNQGKAA